MFHLLQVIPLQSVLRPHPVLLLQRQQVLVALIQPHYLPLEVKALLRLPLPAVAQAVQLLHLPVIVHP